NRAQSDATWSPEQASMEITTEYNLTNRQAEVLLLLIQGKRVRDIEKTLIISNGTARAHVRGVYEKCGVHSRSELMSLVIKTAPR
ncbi:MAG: LuxR C-terminal-related transcriptional regulator, partial [Coriobacteriales bacterium]|nr:LuxR C-terminal-related transcriptional regulator [Coriobacteriales bacterium]